MFLLPVVCLSQVIYVAAPTRFYLSSVFVVYCRSLQKVKKRRKMSARNELDTGRKR